MHAERCAMHASMDESEVINSFSIMLTYQLIGEYIVTT